MDNIKRIAVIILTYNNWQDTIECVPLLLKQIYPEYLIIIVDNASISDSFEKIKTLLKTGINNKTLFTVEYENTVAENGGIPELEQELHKYSSHKKIVLIKNKENLGYSAGNNVGIRYAIKNNADAVLIVNPDVRIEDPYALGTMVETLFSRDDIFIIGPNVIDAEGNRQNPLKEPSFLEECIYPFINVITKMMGKNPKGYLEPINSDNPYRVEKVAGCCLMLRASFLQETGLLDEGVFLYCEESIIAEKVKNKRGSIFFIPEVIVRHLHKKSARRYWQEFFKSREYYLMKYKKYNRIQIFIIMFAHKIISTLLKKKI